MSDLHDPFIETCPVECPSALAPTTLVLPEGALRRCLACGQLISPCTESHYIDSMREFNDPQGTLPNARTQQRSTRRGRKFLMRIAQLLNQPNEAIRLLDVGCSSGAFLRTAAEFGFQVEGVEPAREAAQTARMAGFKVFPGLLQEANFAEAQFDAITLFEVIEHLKSPGEVLRECRRILKPGGILLIGTGNTDSWTMHTMGADWEYLSIQKHGGHISFFNPHSLQLLAERCQFEVARTDTQGVRYLDKNDSAAIPYRLAKIVGELANPLAKLLNKGHDMAVCLRKPAA